MKRIFSIIISAVLLLSFSGCSFQEAENNNLENAVVVSFEVDEPSTATQIEFDEFLMDLYRDYVGSDALSLHFSVKDPSVFDIQLEEASLGSLSDEYLEEANRKLEEDIIKLQSFDVMDLTGSQQRDYEVVSDYLEIHSLSIGEDYFYPLLSRSGVANNLITNFTEFAFREEANVATYLTLLQDTPRYLNEALAFTEKQVAMGLFMSDTAVDNAVEEIEKFIAKKENNELIVTFDARLESLNLPEDEADKQKEANSNIVINEIIPAYEKVMNQLLAWKGSRTTDGGYASLEGGKEYFEYMIKSEVGTLMDVDDLFNLGKEVINDLNIENMNILMQDDSLFDRYIDSDAAFEDASAEEILSDMEEKMLAYYPKGPDVNYSINYLDPSVANSSVVAYYLIPPLDDISENVIKINPDNTTDLNTLYTTLAHEGYPGHCYQNTYFYSLDPHPIRAAYDFKGYSEGWAMKTQLEALTWVLEEDQNLATFLNNETYFLYLIQAMIDIGVNYYDWNKEELKSFLEEYAVLYDFTSEDMLDLFYDQAVSDPGMLLAYGFGLALMETKEESIKDALAENFDAIEYNSLLLALGPNSFDRLFEEIDEYYLNSGKIK